MKHINFLFLIIFILNCNSIVQLRNQKTTASINPEDVSPGCYRQVGMTPPVYKETTTTEVEKGSSKTETIEGKKETINEKVLERPAYNSCSYNGDILFCKEVPAVYKNVTMTVEYPSYTKTIIIPDVQKTISKPVLVSPEKPDVRNVLCPEKATPTLIKRFQVNLKSAGFDPGAEDGQLHTSTMNAIRQYEIKNGFEVAERSGEDYIMQKTADILGK
ncbi:MAG TPA: peptidoglycan-binding domain-containing protein [Leptospiraceae bacterium]|nr:peptidoglycan-binding domain-containing protein [Leptospiraceae bacterium]HMW04339.1 peptidoglycan-binding domain-containing protein [Leptospiraceae bacterium]HMX31091.1 peptidoglycan-binding domain-containing protein [Leptospiraceae bacterium]HMY31907.1 peptidoglycan-binding domain-containing protein [Leptospiraceae bacterium]HMZ65265.1 peptidoglycan-binding domain-containing protein [Leptospiraceae bacterium]